MFSFAFFGSNIKYSQSHHGPNFREPMEILYKKRDFNILPWVHKTCNSRIVQIVRCFYYYRFYNSGCTTTVSTTCPRWRQYCNLHVRNTVIFCIKTEINSKDMIFQSCQDAKNEILSNLESNTF